MGVQLTKDSIDLGIVIRDSEKSLAFYRDTLGFEHVADMPVPGGATMHRLCAAPRWSSWSSSTPCPRRPTRPGGINRASGYRYFTISVGNLADVLAQCEQGGYKVIWKKREIRPGTFVGMVEDPDGNWVEFIAES